MKKHRECLENEATARVRETGFSATEGPDESTTSVSVSNKLKTVHSHSGLRLTSVVCSDQSARRNFEPQAPTNTLESLLYTD